MNSVYETELQQFLARIESEDRPTPTGYLNDVARERLGEGAAEDDVEYQAGLIFGSFVWECDMLRDESFRPSTIRT